MEFTKLQRQRAADEVYQALRQAIVGYHIKPGERLDVEELSGKFGVSLTPVRGALQQLATEGLVEIRPRSGTFVASLTAQDVEETFQLRCALECLAAELGIRNIGPQELRRLKELVRSLRIIGLQDRAGDSDGRRVGVPRGGRLMCAEAGPGGRVSRDAGEARVGTAGEVRGVAPAGEGAGGDGDVDRRPGRAEIWGAAGRGA